MKVFVTGASGYVGTAIVAALVRAGHQVTGQHQAPGSEAALRKAGATPVRAALGSFAALVPQLAQQDAVIHTAADYQPPHDREAIDALLAGARAAGRPYFVLYTSGVWVLGERTTPVAEDAPCDHPAAAVAWRVAHEQLVLEAKQGPIATAVIRPGMVFGGRGGMFSSWMESATKEGAAAFVGTGRQRWSYVHHEDLAELYRAVLEKRAAGIFHGVDGRAEPVGDAARAIAAAAGKSGAVRAIPVEEARKMLGPMADALAMDQVVATARAREVGWAPRHRGFGEEAAQTLRDWQAAHRAA
jgi:nucleoside-diphosphate-sugar epimerase